MSLNVCAGKNCTAKGFCCVAVGDDTHTVGAFQVEVGNSLSLLEPTNVAQDKKAEYWATVYLMIKDTVEVYKDMERQGFAPKGFSDKSTEALTTLMEHVKRRMDAIQTLCTPSPLKAGGVTLTAA